MYVECKSDLISVIKKKLHLKLCFYVSLQVGDMNGMFPDWIGNKPWTDSSTKDAAEKSFFSRKYEWLPSWNFGDANITSFLIDYIRVWAV